MNSLYSTVPAKTVEKEAHDDFLEKRRRAGEEQRRTFIQQLKKELKEAVVKHSLCDDADERLEINEKIAELKRELIELEAKQTKSAKPEKLAPTTADSYQHDHRESMFFQPRANTTPNDINPEMSEFDYTRMRKRKQPKGPRMAVTESMEAERSRMKGYVNRDKLSVPQTKVHADGPLLTCQATESEALADDSALENEFMQVLNESHDLSPSAGAKKVQSLLSLWTEPARAKVTFRKGLALPVEVWNLLFPHQQVAIQWLFELYTLGVGGILADEMGLGKTIEMSVFIGALHYSKILSGVALIVCPATVLAQWLKELQYWVPCVSVYVLHQSFEKNLRARELLQRASRENGIVLTTYATLQKHSDLITSLRRLDCVFLDEGHAIRNPDILTAKVCHKLPTVHRIISTGTPIQNSLQELWGLFHFVHPHLLGTITTFNSIFHDPIRRGSSPKATRHDVRDAYEFSKQLKARIAPFFLRRLKEEVDMHLLGKTEDILYVKLTDDQLEEYRAILASRKLREDIQAHKNLHFLTKRVGRYDPSAARSAQLFRAIIFLRKICNHAWLVKEKIPSVTSETWKKCIEGSAKLQVLLDFLVQWRVSGDKAVVYSQSLAILDLIEQCIACMNAAGENKPIRYVRIDGETTIAHRSGLISALNHDPNVHLGLLTTRVGGLGINLTGCSKVVLFDPDWNPIIDIQARERVWRFGQQKDVAIYRFITLGTIEEKIYHRQLHKLFTMQSVLSKESVNFADMLKFTPEEVTGLFTLSAEYQNGAGPRKAERKARAEPASDANDPMHILKSVLDQKGICHVDSFDEVANRLGIDGSAHRRGAEAARQQAERQAGALGRMQRPERDSPVIEE